MVSGDLGFEYDENRTMTASEAFRTRSGNCVAFSNMIIALARRAGLDARYQEVFLRPIWSDHLEDTVLLVKHVNVVVKSGGILAGQSTSVVSQIHPTDRRRLVDDSYAKALYLNNIAVESSAEERFANRLCLCTQGHRSQLRGNRPVGESRCNLWPERSA